MKTMFTNQKKLIESFLLKKEILTHSKLKMERLESWVDVILNELLMININKCR